MAPTCPKNPKLARLLVTDNRARHRGAGFAGFAGYVQLGFIFKKHILKRGTAGKEPLKARKARTQCSIVRTNHRMTPLRSSASRTSSRPPAIRPRSLRNAPAIGLDSKVPERQ